MTCFQSGEKGREARKVAGFEVALNDGHGVARKGGREPGVGGEAVALGGSPEDLLDLRGLEGSKSLAEICKGETR